MAERSYPLNCYSPRVNFRTILAKTLLDKHVDRYQKVGIHEKDLKLIEETGSLAAHYDTLQKGQLAAKHTDIQLQHDKRDSVDEEADELRNRCRAVIADLLEVEETTDQGLWLNNLSTERFHITVVTPKGEPTDPTKEQAKERKRVEAKDRLSLAESVNQFAKAVLAEGREPIVAAFAARSFAKERLEALRDATQALVDSGGGLLLMTPAEATAMEAEAAATQKQKWEDIRRMLRKAVAGDKDLEALWAKC